MLRHVGPSNDRLKGVRNFDEIQKRGRWLALDSVRRYAKEHALAFVRQQTPQQALAKGAKALRMWGEREGTRDGAPPRRWPDARARGRVSRGSPVLGRCDQLL